MAKKQKKSQKADGKKASGIKQPTNTGVDGNPNVGTIAEEQANIQVAQIPMNPVDLEDAAPLGDTYHRGPVILRGQMIPSDNTTANLLKPDQDTDWLHMDPWRVLRIQSEFVDGFGALAELGPAVSIFGSARTQRTESDYKAARRMGSQIAKRNIAVITGGGPGIMEAANRGAALAGGKSVGLGTLDEMFELLTLVQTHKVANIPVVLYGKDYWQGLFDWLDGPVAERGMISKIDPKLVTVTDDADEAVDVATSMVV